MSKDRETEPTRPKGAQQTDAAEQDAVAAASDAPDADVKRRRKRPTVKKGKSSKAKTTKPDISQADPAKSEPPTFDKDSVSIDRLGPLSGQLLEQRYLIKEKIGAGGMGVVYRAEQTLMRKEMAVKVLLPEYGSIEGIKKRFHREAQSSSRLDHPGITHINDFGETADGLLFIAMEFLDGRSLTDLIRAEAPLPVDRAVRIGLQLCLALDHAHGQGVVHRDLKPDNVILTQRAEHDDVVKVLDFGIAKITQGDGSADALTEVGMVFGTPEYLSPEQAAGQAADARADLYALGIILYELLTGTRPFSGPTKLELIGKHLNEAPMSLRKRAPTRDLPAALDAVVLQTLAKRPEDRTPSAAELFQQLSGIDAVNTGPLPLWPSNTLTMTNPALPMPKRRSQKRRLLLMGGLGGGIIAIIATALVLAFSGKLDKDEDKEKPAATKKVVGKRAPNGQIQAVQQKLASNNIKDAKNILDQLGDQYPTDSRVHLLTGHAHFLGRKHTESLRSFKEAVRLDKAMKRNELILESLHTFLTYLKRGRGWKLRRKAMDFVERYLDAGSKTMMTKFVNKWWEMKLVWRGIAFLSKHGVDDKVNYVHAYELVFRTERNCPKRKLHIKDVLKRRDPRFLPLFKKMTTTEKWRAKYTRRKVSNKCIKLELEAAITVLEALQDSQTSPTTDAGARPAPRPAPDTPNKKK